MTTWTRGRPARRAARRGPTPGRGCSGTSPPASRAREVTPRDAPRGGEPPKPAPSLRARQTFFRALRLIPVKISRIPTRQIRNEVQRTTLESGSLGGLRCTRTISIITTAVLFTFFLIRARPLSPPSSSLRPPRDSNPECVHSPTARSSTSSARTACVAFERIDSHRRADPARSASAS